ncbi:MAG: radical SAM protein [Melioribacteraceae bacterium]
MNKFSLVHIFSTLECNLSCAYCYTSVNCFNNKCKLKEIVTIVNQLEINSLHIEGGEPFINDNIFLILQASIHNEKTSVVTNATLLDSRKLNLCDKYNLSKFIVSIDGSKQIHDKNRCNSYERAINGLELLVKRDFNVTISCTVSNTNIDCLEDIALLALKYNILKIRFGDIICTGKLKDNDKKYFLSDENYVRLIENFNHLKQKFNMLDMKLSLKKDNIKNLVNSSNLFSDLFYKENYCTAGRNQLAFLLNGDIYPCYNLISNHNYCIGNIDNYKNNFYELILNKQITSCPIGSSLHCNFK